MSALILLCAFAFQIVSSSPVDKQVSCKIAEEIADDNTHEIVVVCGDASVTFFLKEHDEHSGLSVYNKDKGVEYLKVDYHRNTKQMFVTISGHKLDVRDRKDVKKEEKLLKKLLKDPDFSFFGDAVKMIHDELKLKGWEAPSVMFLYQLGMAVHSFKIQEKRLVKKESSIDPLTLKYHGPYPERKCNYNGYHVKSIYQLSRSQCLGICGTQCKKCWQWVCGDCCKHVGCTRHDKFCSGPLGYFNSDCLTARGVLWDTITDIPFDC